MTVPASFYGDVITLSLEAADHLLDLYYTQEEQELERHMYSRPMTARMYRSGHRQSPKYIWDGDDLARCDWAMTALGSHSRKEVLILKGVHMEGRRRGRGYDRALRSFVAEWSAWEAVKGCMNSL